MRVARLLRTLLLAALAVAGSLGDAVAQDIGDVEIRLGKGELVQLTKLDPWDIALGPASNTLGFWQYDWDYLCVYSSTGRFQVSLTGANGGTRFRANSGASDTMDYEVWSFSRSNVSFGVPVRHTGPFTLTNRRGSTSLTCADEGYGNSNLFFAPLVRGADYNAAPPGIYTDVVTITVSPE